MGQKRPWRVLYIEEITSRTERHRSKPFLTEADAVAWASVWIWSFEGGRAIVMNAEHGLDPEPPEHRIEWVEGRPIRITHPTMSAHASAELSRAVLDSVGTDRRVPDLRTYHEVQRPRLRAV